MWPNLLQPLPEVEADPVLSRLSLSTKLETLARNSRHERYSTFGSNNSDSSKPKLTNKWEIVLVIFVVAAGIVITTIAAIKAKERSEADQSETLLNNANNVHEVVTASSMSPPTKPKLLTTTSTTTSTTPVPPPPPSVEPITVARDFILAQEAQIPTEPSTTSTEKSAFDEAFNGFYGTDYDTEYDQISPKPRSEERQPEPETDSAEQSGDRPLEADPLAAESVGDDQTRQSNNFGYQDNYHLSHPNDGLPAFGAPNGFRASTEENHNAELSADGAGFVLDELMLAARPRTTPPSVMKHRRHFPNPNSVASIQAQQFEMDRSQSNVKPRATQFHSSPSLPGLDGPSGRHHAAGVPLSLFISSMGLPSAAHKLPVFVEDKDTPSRRSQQSVMASQSSATSVLAQRSDSRNSLLSHQGQMMANPQYHSQSQLSSHNLARFGFPRRFKRSANDQNGALEDHVTKNETLLASASGYFPFEDEHSSIPGPVFDYNDYTNSRRRSYASTNRRSRKRRPNQRSSSHPQAESRQGKKSFGILGSGNFEVIRGGIYSESEEHQASDNNYVRGNRFNKDEDVDDQILGFQGYDNFHSASNTQEDLKKINGDKPISSALSSANNNHPVFVDTDEDLMATA
ncbi:hypothetical protein HDE_10499 [Halotydeus destructor]|nr:hypothetical protein HDE_10499 [Halotydeus destructor]